MQTAETTDDLHGLFVRCGNTSL